MEGEVKKEGQLEQYLKLYTAITFSSLKYFPSLSICFMHCFEKTAKKNNKNNLHLIL